MGNEIVLSAKNAKFFRRGHYFIYYATFAVNSFITQLNRKVRKVKNAKFAEKNLILYLPLSP